MPSEEPLAVARRLDEEGYAAFQRGDTDLARRNHDESLELARREGDPSMVVTALSGLMRVALRTEDWDGLDRLCAEAIGVAAESGDEALLRMPTHMSAESARMRGDLVAARDLYRRSIELNTRLGNHDMIAVECGNLAWVEIGAGDLDEAAALVDRCEAGTAPDDPYGVAFVALTRARVLLERGDRSGTALLASARSALTAAGLVWDPAEQRCYDDTMSITLD
jgi:ATP/maltotriose-dependent transcriptional regulator MalT